MNDYWSIDKEQNSGGETFVITVGRAGVPGFLKVDGLSRAQADALNSVLLRVKDSATWQALSNVRSALGLPK